jgi:hypothetical protein
MISVDNYDLTLLLSYLTHARSPHLIKSSLVILSSLKRSIIIVKFIHAPDLLIPIFSRHHDQISSSLIITITYSPTGSSSSQNLIHIDQHSDLWPNINQLNLSQIHHPQYQWDFAYLECNIGNFITPCIDSWLISNMIQVRTEYKLNEITNIHTPASNTLPIIVDIDLDFRAPEMWISSIETTMSQVRTIIDQADLITIATSPYFIDQWLALELLHQLIWIRIQSHHSCKEQ